MNPDRARRKKYVNALLDCGHELRWDELGQQWVTLGVLARFADGGTLQFAVSAHSESAIVRVIRFPPLDQESE